MGRDLGELQRDLIAVRDHVEDQEKRTEISLEELEALIAAKDEEYNRRFQKQAQQNADEINKVSPPYKATSDILTHACSSASFSPGGLLRFAEHEVRLMRTISEDSHRQKRIPSFPIT